MNADETQMTADNTVVDRDECFESTTMMDGRICQAIGFPSINGFALLRSSAFHPRSSAFQRFGSFS
jgi:hypothetical protein